VAANIKNTKAKAEQQIKYLCVMAIDFIQVIGNFLIENITIHLKVKGQGSRSNFTTT